MPIIPNENRDHLPHYQGSQYGFPIVPHVALIVSLGEY